MTRIFLSFSILLFLAGCRVFHDYSPPGVEIADRWKEPDPLPLASDRELYDDEAWWFVFQDPVLNDLEAQAFAANPTLDEALWRIGEAQAALMRATSFLFPTFDLNPNSSNQLSTTNFPGAASAATGSSNFRFKNTQYQLPIAGSFEPDLWSKYSYGVESEAANVEAQSFNYYKVKLNLEANVADIYFKMRSLDAQADILLSTIRIRQEAFDVNSERYRIGIANYTDVSQAATELQLAKADYAQNRMARSIDEHALAVLLGESPACFRLEYSPLQGTPPVVAPSLPCEVIAYRPDVREAERELEVLFAQEGVAYAAFFPSFTLTAALGFQSPNLDELVAWQSRLWNLSMSILQTIFDAGRKQADFDAARARFQQSFAIFANTVLIALREVDDALAELKWLQEEYTALDEAVASSIITTDLSNARYLHGLVNYLEVVTAERILLESQLTAERARGDQFTSTIHLIRSTGGRAFYTNDTRDIAISH